MPWWMRNCENLDKALYEGVGRFNIPEIAPVLLDNCDFIGFNQAKRCPNPGDLGVHFSWMTISFSGCGLVLSCTCPC